MGQPLPFGVSASGLPPALDVANGVVTGQFLAVGPGLPFEFFGPFNLEIYASINTTLTTTKGSLTASVASGTGITAGVAINSANVPPGTTWASFSGTSGTLALPSITLAGRVNPSVAQISHLRSTAGLVGATVFGPGLPAAGATVVSIDTAAVPTNNQGAAVLGTVNISATPSAASSVYNLNQPYVFALGSQAITTGADTAAIFTGAAVNYSGSVQLERSFDGGATWLCCGVGGDGVQAIYNIGTPVSVLAAEPEKGVAYRLNCTSYTSGTINYRMSVSGGLAMSIGVGSQV